MGQSPFRSSAVQVGVMTLLVFLGVMGLRWEGFLESAELDAYDWSMRFRPTNTRPIPPITLVSITDQDIRTLGHWPVSDEVLARALDVMMTHHPRAIGVDIYRDLEVPPGRQELDRVLEAHPEILMVMKFGKIEKGGIPGPAMLQGTDRVGFNDVIVDSGGIVRRGLLFLDDGTNFYRAFSWLLVLQYLQKEGIVPQAAVENSDWVQLGGTVIRPFESHDGGYVEADAQGYQYLLDLKREENVFPTISFRAILAGTFNPELIQDHIILVGVVAQGVKDYFYTSQCGTLTVCPPIPGIELHAYMVHQLLRFAKGEGLAPIATVPDSLEAVWIGLWVLGGGFIGVWVRGAGRFSLAVLIGMVVLSGVMESGMRYGMWIPFIPPVMGFVVNAMVVTAWLSNREKQDRALLMSLFSRHVSSEVAQAVWEKREQFLEKGRLRPQKLVVTTLFTDLEGFTTVVENMEPDMVLDWLNTYMERMVKIINNYDGLVDDYHGDMIKADFGVFRLGQTEANVRQDVNNAVSCAVALEQEMRHLNSQWQQQGLPEVRMRIGIQTGPVVVGSLGSEQRLKFTTIGDSVNIASRLESFQKDSLETWSKDEVCRILIGGTTKQFLGDHPWGLQEVGVITLRGKANRISVYRLYTKTGSPEPCSVTPIEQAGG